MIKTIISIITILFFILLNIVFESKFGPPLEIDIIINTWSQGIWTESGKYFFIIIAWLGDVYGIIIQALIFAGFLIYKKKYFEFKILTFLILTTVGTSTLLKFFVERERPINMIMEYGGYSFPSGHSSMAVLFYGLLILFFLKNIKGKILKYSSIIFVIIFSFLIIFSRIYLSVHWFTDIIGGILFGSFFLLLGILIYNKSYFLIYFRILSYLFILPVLVFILMGGGGCESGILGFFDKLTAFIIPLVTSYTIFIIYWIIFIFYLISILNSKDKLQFKKLRFYKAGRNKTLLFFYSLGQPVLIIILFSIFILTFGSIITLLFYAAIYNHFFIFIIYIFSFTLLYVIPNYIFTKENIFNLNMYFIISITIFLITFHLSKNIHDLKCTLILQL